MDGRLAGAGQACDLVDAGAGEPVFEKNLLGGVQDPLVDLSSASPGRSADAHEAALAGDFSGHRTLHACAISLFYLHNRPPPSRGTSALKNRLATPLI
jgi:hypothetical protein